MMEWVAIYGTAALVLFIVALTAYANWNWR